MWSDGGSSKDVLLRRWDRGGGRTIRTLRVANSVVQIVGLLDSVYTGELFSLVPQRSQTFITVQSQSYGSKAVYKVYKNNIFDLIMLYLRARVCSSLAGPNTAEVFSYSLDDSI